jgi:NADH-quinone oxidoreductase subunit N
MTHAEVIALVPLMSIAATALVALLMIAIWRHHLAVTGITLLGLAAALVTLWVVTWPLIPQQITPLLVIDAYGLLLMSLLIATSFIVAVLAYGYLDGRDGPPEEFYVLHVLATLGAVVVVVSQHFAALFLGLELLSISLYTLIAYRQTEARALEAGIKYLLLAAAASAFLLFGAALIYAELGTLAFDRMARLLAADQNAQSGLLLIGLAMILTGVGFKLAVVPFHMWTPDVYEGAPAPVTAFIATVSKGAMAALLLRLFVQAGASAYDAVILALSLIAAASMVLGNLMALWQQNVKRLLAYSSIAHLGYLLVAFVAGGSRAAEAVTMYIVAYVVTSLAAFGCVTVLSEKTGDADTLDAYRGLFWRRPGLTVVLAAALFSLAGMPLTAGFMGKFYVVAAAVESASWWLVMLVVLSSALGLFYYLRVVVALYAPLPGGQVTPISTAATAWSYMGAVTLGMVTLFLIGLGIYPVPLIALIRTTVASLL